MRYRADRHRTRAPHNTSQLQFQFHPPLANRLYLWATFRGNSAAILFRLGVPFLAALRSPPFHGLCHFRALIRCLPYRRRDPFQRRYPLAGGRFEPLPQPLRIVRHQFGAVTGPASYGREWVTG